MTDEMTVEKTISKRHHVAAAAHGVTNTWVGLTALFAFALGLGYVFQSGWPLVLVSLLTVTIVACAHYDRSVMLAGEFEAAKENREVVKLAFENAVRSHYVADGHPMAIVQMMGEAAMAGVSQRDLQAIVNRVHESAHPECFDQESTEDDEPPSGS